MSALKYVEAFNEIARKYCLLGTTDKQLADLLGISESTLGNWKIKYPEFKKAIAMGKEKADAEVAAALYKKAVGYKGKKIVTASFQGVIGDVKVVDDFIEPDVRAAQYWLNNRRRAHWSNTEKVEQEVTVNHSLNDFYSQFDEDGNLIKESESGNADG